MKINHHEIGKGRTYVIIEEGQANLGNFDVALEMIELAAEAGADAIEFQLAQADEFYIRAHIGYQIYKDREFSNSQLKELVNHTKRCGIDLIVAPLGSSLIQTMAAYGCSAFNINASDLTNPEIIDKVTEAGIPFFLSLLLAEETEIEWAVNRITQRGQATFGLLLGQHTMASGGHGVELEHTNLGYLKSLKKKYNVPVGFIDHSSKIWSPACAVAAGADLISKHLAISRDDKGPDWQVCLEPNEMKSSIGLIRDMDKSLNATSKTLAPGENIDRTKMRRSIVSTRDIEAGQIIERTDICFKRPGTGINTIEFESVIGKKAIRFISRDKLISFEDIELI